MCAHIWASSNLTRSCYSVEVYTGTSCLNISLQSVKISSTELKELGVSIQFPYIGTYSVWVATEYVRSLQGWYDPEPCSHGLVLSVLAVEGQAGILKHNVSLRVGNWMKLCLHLHHQMKGSVFPKHPLLSTARDRTVHSVDLWSDYMKPFPFFC